MIFILRLYCQDKNIKSAQSKLCAAKISPIDFKNQSGNIRALSSFFPVI